MGKLKKVFAFVTALTLSASAFAGLAITADAESNLPNLTYGGKYLALTAAQAVSNAQLFVAKYNGTALTSVTTETVQVQAGENKFAKSLANGDKVYLWNSDMEPLANVFTASGIQAPYYTLDFEDAKQYAIAASELDGTDTNTWYGYYNNDTTVLATDNNTAIDKYIKKSGASGGGRVSYMLLPESAGTLVNNQSALEFDFALERSGYAGWPAELVVSSSSGRVTSNLRYADTSNFVVKFVQPSDGSGEFIIGQSSDDSTDPAIANAIFKSSGYTSASWAHATAVLDFTKKTALIKITSLDGTKTYFGPSNVPMGASASGVKSIILEGGRGGAPASIDNIVVRPVVADDTAEIYYNATFDVAGKKSVASVKSGQTVTEIPSTDRTGYIFDGWYKNNETTLLSNDDVKALTIDDDVTFTAQYHVDTTYVHKIKKVEFVTTAERINQPAEGETNTKEYEVKVTSENGDDISDIEGMTYTWDMKGAEKDDQYVGFTTNGKTASVSVASGVERSYFGYIKVTASYDPANSDNAEDNSSDETQIPYAILLQSASTSFIPEVGYPSDFNSDGGYADSIVDYKATVNGQDDKDIVMNNWSIYGSNGDRTLTLRKDAESGDKYFEFASNGGGGSTVGIYRWTSQTKPYILEMTLNMPAGAYISLTDRAQNDSQHSEVWGISQGSDAVTLSDVSQIGGTVSGAKASEWYKLVVIGDPTSNQYYAKAYSESGTLLGTSDIVTSKEDVTQKYLCLSGAYPILLKGFSAYNPTVSTATIAGNATVRVPDSGTTTANYAASFADTNENVIPAAATWSLTEEKNGVSIDEKTGVLTVSSNAAGTVTIKAVSGEAVATKEVRLLTSSNAIELTGPSAITIPFAGSEAATGTYSAQTLGPDSNPIAGDEITYAFLKKDGATAYTTLPNGIEFNESTGVLSVSSDANPVVIYIQATNKEGLIESKQINIHGRSYVFGTTEPAEDSGDTLVGVTQYTNAQEYGFAATTGLTANASDVSGTEAFKFQVKVPNGNYRVEIAGELPTNGVISSEAVSGSATGTSKGLGTSRIAVCDEILDLTFPAGSKVSSVAISQIAPDVRTKPAVFAIGDSTTRNSGHYNGYDASSTTNDHKSYKSWGNCVTADMYSENFSNFTNKGNAGKNSASYYNLGDLESVLLAISPGDYVTINMGINSQGNEPYEDLMENYYVKGVIQRGGIPVILTHTPDGVGFSKSQSSYDAATGKFNVARANNDRVVFLKSLATKYADDGAQLIDVGLKFENYFNQLQFNDATYAMRNTENEGGKLAGYNPPTNVYELVRTWYPDHNHYTAELGEKIAKYVMHELTAIENKTSRDDATSGILPFEDAGNASN